MFNKLELNLQGEDIETKKRKREDFENFTLRHRITHQINKKNLMFNLKKTFITFVQPTLIKSHSTNKFV